MYNAINCTGQNTIFDNSSYDIYNGCSYTLDAIGVYWKNGNPNNSVTYGPIYKSLYLTTDPWTGIPLPKQDASSYQSNDPLLVGSQLRGDGKYKEAKDFYISYLEKNPDDQRAYVELYSCYTKETASDITKYFEKAAKKDKEQDLLLGYIYLKKGKIKPAKFINDAVLSSSKNNRITTLASLNNFYITLYYENDATTASAILEKLKTQKNETNEQEIAFAEYALRTYVPAEFKIEEIQPKELAEQEPLSLPDKLLLFDNYPNPFNPTTTIRYQIPQDGHISIKVYDMLGREVAQLVNEVKRAGEYTVSFDGSKLSSGVYIYKLVGNNVNLSKKMILMK
ncbi:MAG: T9SS type A sorting domain-containing protein [Ignavibacteria bacterium]|nr:T9SS type A sorting domain-containing protein [Ignavibacteria bacterium]